MTRKTTDRRITAKDIKSLFWEALDTARKADKTEARTVVVTRRPETLYGIDFDTDADGWKEVLLVHDMPLLSYPTGVVRWLLDRMYQHLPHLFADDVTPGVIHTVVDQVVQASPGYQLSVYCLFGQATEAHVTICEGLDFWHYIAPMESEMLSRLAGEIYGQLEMVSRRPRRIGAKPGPRLEPISVVGAIGWTYIEE